MNDRDRYTRATHCMQAGVKADMVRSAEHPQLRIGINVALRDHASLIKLLIAKGLLTEAEYDKALADGMEEEVRLYEERLGGGGGVKIILFGAYGSIHDEETTS